MEKHYKFDEQISLAGRGKLFRLLPLFGAITVWALTTGYYQIFSIFAPYDDEGFLMMTVKRFLNGGVLYDEVFTQYGSFYYIYKWFVHGLLNLPVTHNDTRLVTLVIWVSTAFLCGIFTYRLTRSTLSGAAGYILTFLILFRTIYEPGHPQDICGFLLICSLLLLIGENRGRAFDVQIASLGVVLALLFLTKVNLGVFLGFAVVIAFLALSAKTRAQRFLLIGLTLSGVFLPFILFGNFLSLGWFRLCILVAVALISTLITSLLRTDETAVLFKHYLIAAAAFCLTAIAVFLFAYFQNSTLDAFIYGVFIQHLKFSDNFFQPAPIQRFAHFWGIIALLTALGILFFKKKLPVQTSAAVSFLKFSYGFCVILISFLDYRHFLNVFALLSFATPFVWLMLLNSDVHNFKQNRLPRMVLVLAAVLMTLQIFPISGTQMNYGSFLMMIIAVVCLTDALGELKILLPKVSEKWRLQVVSAAVLSLLIVSYAAYRAYDAYEIYSSQTRIEFEGADRIRLPEKDSAVYTFLVENLKSRCGSFVSMPGLYSLNFWTQIEPPTTFDAPAWFTLLTDAQQKTNIEQIKNYAGRTCAVYNTELTRNSLRDKSLESIPQADYILKNHVEAGRIGNFLFLTGDFPKTRLVYAARFYNGKRNSIEFTLPEKQYRAAASIQLYDSQSGEIILDSKKDQISVYDSQNQPLNLPLDLSDSPVEENSFRLTYSAAINSTETNDLLLRLLDSEDNLIASLPFLSN